MSLINPNPSPIQSGESTKNAPALLRVLRAVVALARHSFVVSKKHFQTTKTSITHVKSLMPLKTMSAMLDILARKIGPFRAKSRRIKRSTALLKQNYARFSTENGPVSPRFRHRHPPPPVNKLPS
jgi:hypothetical protein